MHCYSLGIKMAEHNAEAMGVPPFWSLMRTIHVLTLSIKLVDETDGAEPKSREEYWINKVKIHLPDLIFSTVI